MASAGDGGDVRGTFISTNHSSTEGESDSANLDNSTHWRIWGSKLPKQEIVYFCQVFLVYIVVITCITNLTLGRDEGKIWIALLSSCLGYLLPNPSIKHLSLPK